MNSAMKSALGYRHCFTLTMVLSLNWWGNRLTTQRSLVQSPGSARTDKMQTLTVSCIRRKLLWNEYMGILFNGSNWKVGNSGYDLLCPQENFSSKYRFPNAFRGTRQEGARQPRCSCYRTEHKPNYSYCLIGEVGTKDLTLLTSWILLSHLTFMWPFVLWEWLDEPAAQHNHHGNTITTATPPPPVQSV